MSINDTVKNLSNAVTDSLLLDIEKNVQKKAMSSVVDHIKNLDLTEHIDRVISQQVAHWLSTNEDWLQKTVTPIAAGVKNAVLAEITKQAHDMITSTIKNEVSKFDGLASQAMSDTFARNIKQFSFPDESIPLASIKFGTKTISGDKITGGIIKNFNSTGIQDGATECMITVLNDNTVVENTLLASGLRVVGTTRLEGPVHIFGEVDKNSDFYQTLINDTSGAVSAKLDDALFTGFSDKVFSRIQEQGIAVDKLALGDKPIIEKNTLTSTVMYSNLRTVGSLKELQVDGEFMVNNGSLYVGKKRVGINTIEPSGVLSVWDSEVEFEFSKCDANAGFIGLPRKQELVVGVNNQNNLRLMPDGSTRVKKLQIGAMSFESASTPPNYGATKGAVVFNSNPSEGGPMGWICLGGPKWANFGVID
jgi:hypothetical protein